MENISPKNRKIWFITGASKGLGLELAKQLLATGHQVAATTRRLATLEGALGRENDNFLPLEADLINEVSVKNAVAKTVQKFGHCRRHRQQCRIRPVRLHRGNQRFTRP